MNVTHTDLYPLAVSERRQVVNQLALLQGFYDLAHRRPLCQQSSTNGKRAALYSLGLGVALIDV
jgi:hypothetical protein